VRHDAVIFDLFGTLIDTVTPTEYGELLATLAIKLGASPEHFETEWRTAITEREAGSLGGVPEILRTTARRAGGDPTAEAVESASSEWLASARRWLTPRGRTLETLHAFHDAGYAIGLLSNCSAEVPTLWPDTVMAPAIQAPVFSCDVGMMKPDPRIYENVCAALSVEPERCMFLGDGGSRELTGATALGMEAVLLRVPGEEHTWFDENYRLDALEWIGARIAAIEEATRFIE
jgi:putative hydrolase of the HAD superfamily